MKDLKEMRLKWTDKQGEEVSFRMGEFILFITKWISIGVATILVALFITSALGDAIDTEFDRIEQQNIEHMKKD